MSWTILVRSNEEHNEYWSAEAEGDGQNGARYTGRVMYGSLARRDTREHQYDSDEAVRRKFEEKIRNGYVIVATASEGFMPTSFEEVTPTGAIGRVSLPRRRTPRRVVDEEEEEEPIKPESPVERVEHRISLARIPKYVTNRQGYIKKLEPGYHRPKQAVTTARTRTRAPIGNYVFYDKHRLFDGTPETTHLIPKAKAFYESIPRGMVYKKPRFGQNENDIFGQHTGKFLFGFERRTNVCVACFEMYVNGKSEFVYIKTAENNYTTLLKEVIKSIVTLRGNINYALYIKGQVLRDKLLEVIPGAREAEPGVIKFSGSQVPFASREVQTQGMTGASSSKQMWQDLEW